MSINQEMEVVSQVSKVLKPLVDSELDSLAINVLENARRYEKENKWNYLWKCMKNSL